MFLQAAIDTLTIREAEELLTRYASIPEIDVVEIGTPLISHYGVSIVERFSKYLDVSRIYADLKLIDFPSIELGPYMDVGVTQFSAMATLNNGAFEVLRKISEDSGVTIFVSTLGYR